ncbi:MAG: HlyC/CorC family transporter [Clostridia bacterium]|nr:HlyC/CorC family transporter [Clostridia bacterium]
MQDHIWSIVVMVIMVVFSAYFSATETAFSSINKTRLRTLAEKGNKRAERVLKLAENYDKLLSTILIGNNIVNIVLASLCTLMFVDLLKSQDTGATVSTVVSTVVVLIFGEVTPKSLAKEQPENWAMFSAPFLKMLVILLTPLNFLFGLWKTLITRLTKAEEAPKMTQDELLMLVDEVEQEGTIDEQESNLLRNAIDFTDQEAEEVLTHRTDLEAVPMDATKEEIAAIFSESKFSRLPVYEDSIDNIIGILHQKDFYTGTGVSDKPLAELITPPLFVPKSEKISDLLGDLQKNKSHIAIVVDEYGGTLGIVTMEDILEELVGEIWDEHDAVVESYKKLSEDTYRIDCSLSIDDLCQFYDIELETDSIVIGGWVMEMLGKIPEEGDTFTHERLTVTVAETEGHSASWVDITLAPEETETEAEE